MINFSFITGDILLLEDGSLAIFLEHYCIHPRNNLIRVILKQEIVEITVDVVVQNTGNFSKLWIENGI